MPRLVPQSHADDADPLDIVIPLVHAERPVSNERVERI
jgi:hypothetical protein